MALEELERHFTAEYHPVTPAERSLVDSLIHLEWMLRRYRWLETEVWKSIQDLLTRDQLESGWTGHAFISQPAIARIHRLRITTQRAFHETLAELHAAQSNVGRAGSPRSDWQSPPSTGEATDSTPDESPVAAESQTQSATSEEIGFVPPDTTPAPDPWPPAPIAAPDEPPSAPFDLPPVEPRKSTNRPPDPVV
jgi:hypothetical protein